jgi:hypothetical protein
VALSPQLRSPVLGARLANDSHDEEDVLLFVVVLPITPGSRARVNRLLANELPFDLETAGFESHEVLVSDEEVVFVFEVSAEHVRDQLAAEISAWSTGGAWKDLGAGEPRFAETAYASRHSEPPVHLSSAPTPGPGDSDGGDIFAP